MACSISSRQAVIGSASSLRDYHRWATSFSSDWHLGSGPPLLERVNGAAVQMAVHGAHNHRAGPIEASARVYPPRTDSESAQDNHWAGRVRDDVLTHRAQQHAREAPAAAGPDHHQVGPLGHIDQYLGWASL